MTLVEVMIALVILVGAMMSLGRFTTDFARLSSASRSKGQALEIALARLDSARAVPVYTSLPSLAETNVAVPNYSGFKRTTFVAAAGAATGTFEYTTVTVSVQPPAGAPAVKKTTIIGAF